MVAAADCIKKYGQPDRNASWLTYYHVPKKYQINNIPKMIWCNKDLVKPLEKAFANLIGRGFISELCTWDGCFNIRDVRGGNSPSLHSWAIAIDINAADNPLGWSREKCIESGRVPFSDGFVQCFTDSGFDWGGNFSRADGMHFQLSKI